MATKTYDFRFDLNTNISKPYIYKDISKEINTTTTAVDELATITDIECVKNGIKNIFTYRQGERILLPTFGNNLDKFLYEPINTYTAENIGIEITNMITVWEPRVEIKNISVIPKTDENQYNVTVVYTIPSLSNQIIKFNRVLSK